MMIILCAQIKINKDSCEAFVYDFNDVFNDIDIDSRTKVFLMTLNA